MPVALVEPPGELAADVPVAFLGNPASLFAEAVAAYPSLRGKFPRLIESNYCSGWFVPAAKVNELPGPPGAVLLKEGKNELGGVGKLYFFEEDAFFRIEPELFEDEDSSSVEILHWASSCGRLVAATSERF